MTPPDPRALRQAFGSFMTGVTVVTTRDHDGTPVGFTANSFTSVSLDPPLLLVCPGRFLSRFATFETASHFSVSVLAEGQEDVSNIFAKPTDDRFAQVRTANDPHGIPLIHGAAATFSCETAQVVPAGDHIILIGAVRAFTHSEQRGLGYAAGRYFSLGLERDAALRPDHGLSPVAAAIVECENAVMLLPTTAGYTLPACPMRGRGTLRSDISAHLQTLGLTAALERVYSVYDDRKAGLHHTCFRALADKRPGTAAGHFVPIRDLPDLRYATAAEAAMLTRYAVEHESQSFGLYIGDAEAGDIHP